MHKRVLTDGLETVPATFKLSENLKWIMDKI